MKTEEGVVDSGSQPLDINKILDALKFEFRLRNDIELAAWLGVPNVRHISVFRFRNRITAYGWELILSKILRSGRDPRKFLFLNHQTPQVNHGNIQEAGRRIRASRKTKREGEGIPPSADYPEAGS